MKIKTFNSFLNDAETAINKFLEDKTYIDLKTDTVVHNNKIFTQYTLIYEDGGKTEEVPVQTMDGVTTYMRAKGSNEPFQRVDGWSENEWRQSSEWPKEWARIKNNK